MRVRPASADEWPLVRDVRLRALAEDETAFGHTHALASARSDEDWRQYGATRDGDAVFLAAVAAWARRDGARTLALWVAEDRPAARALYARCGFVETGKVEDMPHHAGVRVREMVLRMEDSSAHSSADAAMEGP